MIELNLLPDVKQEFVHAQRLRRKIISIMILLIIVSIGIVALIAFNLYVVQGVHERLVDGDIKNHTKELEEKRKNLISLYSRNRKWYKAKRPKIRVLKDF